MSRAEDETPIEFVERARRLGERLPETADRMALKSILAELLRLRCDAGRLGDEVQALIQRKVIDVRSPAGDALLDFRDPPRTARGDRLAATDAEMERLKTWSASAQEVLRRLGDFGGPRDGVSPAYHDMSSDIVVLEDDTRPRLSGFCLTVGHVRTARELTGGVSANDGAVVKREIADLHQEIDTLEGAVATERARASAAETERTALAAEVERLTAELKLLRGRT